MPKGYWKCHGLDHKCQPCGYMVPRGKPYCDACGHQPPPQVSGKEGKGQGKGKAQPKAKAEGTRQPARQPAADKRAADASKEASLLRAQLQEKEKALAAEREAREKTVESRVAEIEARLMRAPAGGPASAVGPAAGDPTEDAKLATEEVKAANLLLQEIQNITPGSREAFFGHLGGGYEEALARAKERVDAAFAKRRGLKGLEAQLASAEAHCRKSDGLIAAHKAKGQAIASRMSALIEEAGTHDMEGQRLEAAGDKAHKEVALLHTQLCAQHEAERRQEADIKPPEVAGVAAPTFVPGSDLWNAVGEITKLAENDEVRQVLHAAGMREGVLQTIALQVTVVNEAAAASAAATVRADEQAGVSASPATPAEVAVVPPPEPSAETVLALPSAEKKAAGSSAVDGAICGAAQGALATLLKRDGGDVAMLENSSEDSQPSKLARTE
jgi:hypothetical protein